MKLQAQAQDLLHSETMAALGTLSQREPGFPYVSRVAFAVHNANLVLVISDLAEHTKNLNADPNLSLLITGAQGGYDDARLTVLGQAKRTDDAQYREAFAARFPDARFLQLPDFRTYRVQISRARMIAGFGSMGWFNWQ